MSRKSAFYKLLLCGTVFCSLHEISNHAIAASVFPFSELSSASVNLSSIKNSSAKKLAKHTLKLIGNSDDLDDLYYQPKWEVCADLYKRITKTEATCLDIFKLYSQTSKELLRVQGCLHIVSMLDHAAWLLLVGRWGISTDPTPQNVIDDLQTIAKEIITRRISYGSDQGVENFKNILRYSQEESANSSSDLAHLSVLQNYLAAIISGSGGGQHNLSYKDEKRLCLAAQSSNVDTFVYQPKEELGSTQAAVRDRMTYERQLGERGGYRPFKEKNIGPDLSVNGVARTDNTVASSSANSPISTDVQSRAVSVSSSQSGPFLTSSLTAASTGFSKIIGPDPAPSVNENRPDKPTDKTAEFDISAAVELMGAVPATSPVPAPPPAPPLLLSAARTVAPVANGLTADASGSSVSATKPAPPPPAPPLVLKIAAVSNGPSPLFSAIKAHQTPQLPPPPPPPPPLLNTIKGLSPTDSNSSTLKKAPSHERKRSSRVDLADLLSGRLTQMASGIYGDKGVKNKEEKEEEDDDFKVEVPKKVEEVKVPLDKPILFNPEAVKNAQSKFAKNSQNNARSSDDLFKAIKKGTPLKAKNEDLIDIDIASIARGTMLNPFQQTVGQTIKAVLGMNISSHRMVELETISQRYLLKMEEEEDESDWDNEDTSIVASSPYPNKFTDYEDTVAPPVELFFDFEEHILYLSDLDIEELNEGLLFQDDLDEEERTFSTIVSILGFKSQVEAIEAFILEKKESPRSKMKCNTIIALDVKTSETSGVAYEKVSSITI